MVKKYMMGFLGLFIVAVVLFVGLWMIADAGYNDGSINQMLDGAIILVGGCYVGANVIDYSIKLSDIEDGT